MVNLPPIIGYSRSFEKIFYPTMGWEFHTLESQALDKVYSEFHGPGWIQPNITRLPHAKTSFPTHIITPDTTANIDITLNEACRIRAQELIDRNQEIVLFWSGGLDSTLILCFLLTQMKYPNQISVYYTPESVRENPEFVDYIKKFNVKMVRWDLEYMTLFREDQLIVTGNLGDSCSGTVEIDFYNTNKQWLHYNWQEFFLHKQFKKNEIESIESLVRQHNIDGIHSLLDFHWWFNNYVKYQFYICVTYLFNFENVNKNPGQAFFDCDVLNHWSKSNRFKLKDCQTQLEYKQCFRDEIAKFWNINNYVVNKPKVVSRHSFTWLRIKLLHCHQDFLFLYWQDGKIKSYMPKNYPILNQDQILQDLEGMQ